MKNLINTIVIVGIAVIMILPVSTFAQMMHNSGTNNQGMMQQQNPASMGQTGMMGMHKGMCGMMGMMGNNPQLNSLMSAIYRLPDQALQLNLTEKQVQKLLELQGAFLKKKIDLNGDLKIVNFELQKLINKNAPVSEVKKVLDRQAALQESLSAEVYATYQKMISVLTKEQRDKFNSAPGQMMMPMGKKSGMHR